MIFVRCSTGMRNCVNCIMDCVSCNRKTRIAPRLRAWRDRYAIDTLLLAAGPTHRFGLAPVDNGRNILPVARPVHGVRPKIP
ncbi:hypothetical protein SPHINGO391_400063 [Sphingomonas aurantiaca]|uniref:Uncharacterized protein n=1 Tax=Sphingomonas aurantiaca TaxID=185949 RepID=A0A5E7YXB6_9SPHN|nr:hypothetical protein SPHINGO391_400063 [Sphingomonas aurantiaca]